MLESHIGIEISKDNLGNSQKIIELQEQSSAKFSNMESMLDQIKNMMLIHFKKQEDVSQSARLLQERVDESIQEPERSGPLIGEGSTLQGKRHFPDLT